jgi:hypothetical protein
MAMVHVARQSLDTARRLLEEGTAVQDRLGAARSRFPANGLHWMLGLLRLARGDLSGSLAAFERERGGGDRTLYAREYTVAALNGQGWALLETGRPAEADASFRASLQMHLEQVRPHLGLALVAQRQGDSAGAEEALAAARQAIEQLRQGGRAIEAALMSAADNVVQERNEHAVDVLESLLLQSDSRPAGWIVPIDPFFRPLTGSKRFAKVLERIAERAA